MAAYANLHIAFEQMRVRALRTLHGSPSHDDDPSANTEPPRVLILGPENSGKTTVSKILINYAVRAGQGWSPLLVNVDPSEVSIHTYRFPKCCLTLCREVGQLRVLSQSPLFTLPFPLVLLQTLLGLQQRQRRRPSHLMLYYP